MAVQKKEKEESSIGAMLDQAADRVPKYAPYIKMVKPYVIMAADLADQAYPYAVIAYNKGNELWVKLEPYDPQQFFPLLMGFILCFFGGSYLTLVAAVEAIRISVWEKLYSSFEVLYKNYKAAKAASDKDDLVDDNDDGIPDVQQISKKDLLTRKLYVAAKSMDPDKVSEALALIWGGILSVIATLRIQFAQSVTLGCSIGEMLQRHFNNTLKDALDQALPPELKKWAPPCAQYGFKVAGVLIAWFLQRIISGFHSAMRGGNLAVINGVRLAKKHGYLPDDFEETSPKTSIAGTALGLLGFYWQFSNGFALPFPLNLILLPVTILEWVLSVMVGL